MGKSNSTRRARILQLAIFAGATTLALTLTRSALGNSVTSGGDTVYAWNWTGSVDNSFMNNNNWYLGNVFPNAPVQGDLDIYTGPIAQFVNGSFSYWQLPVNQNPTLSQTFTSPYLVMTSYNATNSLTLASGANYSIPNAATIGCSFQAANSYSGVRPPDQPPSYGPYPISGPILGTPVPATLYINSGSAFSSATLNIGYDSSGNVTQTGGTISVAGDATLGNVSGGAGTYALSGTGVLSVSGNEYVGNGGNGTFTQTGGTHTVYAFMNVGNISGSTGSYSISDGTLTATEGMFLGVNGGTGTYSQSGGNVTIDYRFKFGNHGANSTGTGTQTGGSLNCTQFYAGNDLGTTGIYNLGGSGSPIFQAGAAYIGNNGNGTFNQSGGVSTILTVLDLGFHAGATGNYLLSGNGSLSVGDSEYVGDGGNGTFTQIGGTHSVTNTLTVAANAGSTGVYNLQGGTLTSGAIVVNSGGSFSQNAGTLVVPTFTENGGSLTFSGGGSTFTVGTGNVGTYSLQGGTLTAGTICVGAGGTITQSGGTVNASNFVTVGDQAGSVGTYALSGSGSLAVSGNEYVGYSGNGTFTQTGGTNTLTTPNSSIVELYVGYNSGSTGSYLLSGTGSLTASYESIGYEGTGTVTQSGGNNTVGVGAYYFLKGLYIASQSTASIGTYNLSGTGSITAQNEYVGNLGTGTLNQSGGTNTVNGLLIVGHISGSTGSYSQTGGTNTVNGDLNVAQLVGSIGSYSISAGSNNVSGNLIVGAQATSSGTYNLSGTGLLSVSSSEYVGSRGAGTFTQIGGSNIAGTLTIAAQPGSTGVYNLQGGTLTAGTIQINPSGSFTQTGGTLSNAIIFQQTGGFSSFGGQQKLYNFSSMFSNGGTTTFTTDAAKIISTNSLSLTSPATIDITHNKLLVHYSGASAYSTILGDVAAGEITSSSVGTVNGHAYRLAVVDSSDPNSFLSGVALNTVVIVPALAGDIRLTGTADFGDYQILLAYYGIGTTWETGDFHYSGTTGFGDYQNLLLNYGAVSSLTDSQLASIEAFGSSLGAVVTPNADGFGFTVTVPEPSSTALMGIFVGMIPLQRDRMRKNS